MLLDCTAQQFRKGDVVDVVVPQGSTWFRDGKTVLL